MIGTLESKIDRTSNPPPKFLKIGNFQLKLKLQPAEPFAFFTNEL